MASRLRGRRLTSGRCACPACGGIRKASVGHRHRKNVEDRLDTLVDSIRELGQLQPIVIDEAGTLIAGLRRLKACERLGQMVRAVTITTLNGAIKRLKA